MPMPPETIGTIVLPFPEKILWPNGRGHWAVKAKAVKKARADAAWYVAGFMSKKPNWEKVSLRWVIHPKTAHKIDDDAPASALKAYRDGIADAIGIDDKNFTATYEFGPPIKYGLVIVTIEEIEE